MKTKQKTSFSIAVRKFHHNLQQLITKYFPANFRFDSLHAMSSPKIFFSTVVMSSYLLLRPVTRSVFFRGQSRNFSFAFLVQDMQFVASKCEGRNNE